MNNSFGQNLLHQRRLTADNRSVRNAKGYLDITLNNRFFGGKRIEKEDRKEIKPMRVHEYLVPGHDKVRENLQNYRSHKMCPVAKPSDATPQMYREYLSNAKVEMPINEEWKRGNYEAEHGYKEGQGYLSDRDPDRTDGMFYYYSSCTRKKQQDGVEQEKVQMLVSVTMYNEDYEALSSTLIGIHNNLLAFKKDYSVDPSQVVVVVFQDGIMKIDKTPDFTKDLNVNLNMPDEHEQQNGGQINQNRSIRFNTLNQAGDIEAPDEDEEEEERKNFNLKLVDEFQDEDNIISNRRWVYERLDQKVTRNEREHPLQERQQMIYHEAKFYRSQGLAMQENWPASLPRNTALLYQMRLSYDDYLQSENTLKDLGYTSDDRRLKMRTFFLFKHLNNRKLSSQMWLFQGFCRQFKPKYIALVDVGTRPHRLGLSKYYFAMECNANVGGVSGFMGLYMRDKNCLVKSTGIKSCEGRFKSESTERNQDNNRARENSEGSSGGNEQRSNNKDKCGIGAIFKWLINCPSMVIGWIGGCCWSAFKYVHLGFDVEVAQLYEYTVAHILDKNFESALGFLQVLPGAWSAYRRKALFQSRKFTENLIEHKYLKTVLNPDEKPQNLQEANVYLAEDRILSLGIVCQEKQSYFLEYVPDAYAQTDAVKNFAEFMRQRRRWINSTWFALEYVTNSYRHYLEKSNHTWWFKNVNMPLVMLMARLGKINSFLYVGLFYTALHLSSTDLLKPILFNLDQQKHWHILYFLPGIIPGCYILLILYVYLSSITFQTSTPGSAMARKNQASFYVVSAMIGIFQMLMFLLIVLTFWFQYGSDWYDGILQKMVNTQLETQESQVSVEAPDPMQTPMDGVYLRASQFYISRMDKGFRIVLLLLLGINLLATPLIGIMHAFTCSLTNRWKILYTTIVNFFPSYIYYSGAYTHTLVIYSFANQDDVSWGTKGSTQNEDRELYTDSKIHFVGTWMLSNVIIAFLIILINKILPQGIVLVTLGTYSTFPMAVKFVFAIFNHAKYFCCRRKNKNLNKIKMKNENKAQMNGADDDQNSSYRSHVSINEQTRVRMNQ